MTTPRDERRLALIHKFQELALERVDRIGQAWLALERAPQDAQTAAELLRELHTVKGEARAVGFPDIGQLAHRTESLVFRARERGYKVEQEVSDLVLSALDVLTILLRRPLEQGPPQADLAEILGLLDAALPGAAPAPAAPTGAQPAAPAQLVVAPAAPAAAAAPAARQPRALPRSIGDSPTLRVRADRITALSDQTSELLVGQVQHRFLLHRLQAAVEELGAALAVSARALQLPLAGPVASVRLLATQLEEQAHTQEQSVRALDGAVHDLRLIPVAVLFDSYSRLVRDLAHDQHKQVALRVEGAELEVDKRILELLEEPLLHLVRNALDHGLELPDARVAAGKPAGGSLAIRVSQRGGELLLTIEDDGCGLDPAFLRQHAIARGLLSAASAASLGDAQALELIFLPGFSTRQTTSELSGRGVGMDVVKRRIEQLGGRIRLGGGPGRGLVVELSVPAAISLTPAWIATLGSTTYAIPSACVEAVWRVETGDVLWSHEGRSVRNGERVLPLGGLAELVDARPTSTPYCVVLRSGVRRGALLVPAAGHETSIVVKPLGAPLRRHTLVAGAAVLEDGSLALVLDADRLLREQQRRGATAGAAQERASGRTRILAVDDSPVVRDLVAELLRRLGHEVEVAEDGARALEKLLSFDADLVITDLDMPRMDGLELIARLRAAPALEKLPVLVLSSRGAAEEKQRALEAGADAYLVKTELDEGALAAAIRRLVA